MANLIINLTQHVMTQEQYFLNGEDLTEVKFRPYNGLGESVHGFVKGCLNFNYKPDRIEIDRRALVLAEYAQGLLNQVKGDNDKLYALVGGAPYLMGPLEQKLKERGIQPLYAFSQRESVETRNTDGTVVKTAVFKHIGYIEA